MQMTIGGNLALTAMVVCASIVVPNLRPASASQACNCDAKRQAAFVEALKRFDSNPIDLGPAVQKEAQDARSPYSSLACMLMSFGHFTEADTFAASIRDARAAVEAAARCREDQARAFMLKPTIEYFKLMAPSQQTVALLRKKPHLIVPYATVLHHHAQVFHQLKLRALMYEASSSYSVLSQEFRDSVAEVRTMGDQIKTWSIELNKDHVSGE